MRIDNDPVALSLAMAEAGPNPEVAIEAGQGLLPVSGTSSPSISHSSLLGVSAVPARFVVDG